MRSSQSLPKSGWALLLALAVAVPLGGCPGDLTDPGRFSGQFGGGGGGGTGGSDAGTCPDVPMLFATTCTGSGCHNSASPVEGLDLQSPGLYARLSGVKPMGGPGLLIDPANPASSVVYLKLMSPPPFGSRMPLTGTPLSAADIACVLSWITSN
jgi:hypothetical protein